MVRKAFNWNDGVVLPEHSKKKHKILSEYFRKYLITRCKIPFQTKFSLAIVDGFCGAGTYKCGSYGSPLIFIETLKNTFEEINIYRKTNRMKPISIECYFVFNDYNKDAIEQLKIMASSLESEIKDTSENLYLHFRYYNEKFEDIYPKIKKELFQLSYKNVIFNLDQAGYIHVSKAIIIDIMQSWKSAEIFLTFLISSILKYLSTNEDKDQTLKKFSSEIRKDVFSILKSPDEPISKVEFLGRAEQIVFEHLKQCATYTSPFSINNPDGYRYWFMHFANSYKARQVYNDVLHDNNSCQAHFGNCGLNMLSYSPNDGGMLYTFNDESREKSKEALHNDIPKLVSEHGDALTVEDFYIASYNGTVAHSNDIHDIFIENPDLQVITSKGGERRSSNTIKSTDTLKLKNQKSFFPMFSDIKKIKQQ